MNKKRKTNLNLWTNDINEINYNYNFNFNNIILLILLYFLFIFSLKS